MPSSFVTRILIPKRIIISCQPCQVWYVFNTEDYQTSLRIYQTSMKMKVSTLIHNPGAGAEKYTKEQLTSRIESLGYECRYSSTKNKGWKDIDPDTDFVIIAGGDGT